MQLGVGGLIARLGLMSEYKIKNYKKFHVDKCVIKLVICNCFKVDAEENSEEGAVPAPWFPCFLCSLTE